MQLMLISLNGVFAANLGLVGIGAKLAEGTSLVQQTPARRCGRETVDSTSPYGLLA